MRSKNPFFGHFSGIFSIWGFQKRVKERGNSLNWLNMSVWLHEDVVILCCPTQMSARFLTVSFQAETCCRKYIHRFKLWQHSGAVVSTRAAWCWKKLTLRYSSFLRYILWYEKKPGIFLSLTWITPCQRMNHYRRFEGVDLGRWPSRLHL